MKRLNNLPRSLGRTMLDLAQGLASWCFCFSIKAPSGMQQLDVQKLLTMLSCTGKKEKDLQVGMIIFCPNVSILNNPESQNMKQGNKFYV